MERQWGLFISFEGGEAVGKSTVVKRLAHTLVDEGVRFITTREPGGSPISEQIRAIVKDPHFNSMDYRTEALLMLSARAQLVTRTYLPALAEGTIILADRYIDSTYAYQVFGRGLDMDTVRQMNTFATDGLLPDRTYLLDAPIEIIKKRLDADKRPKDRLDDEAVEFFHKVRQGYLQLAQAEPQRFMIIDATQTAEGVYSQIWQDIVELRQQKLHIRK
jgi:dTMP kinase